MDGWVHGLEFVGLGVHSGREQGKEGKKEEGGRMFNVSDRVERWISSVWLLMEREDARGGIRGEEYVWGKESTWQGTPDCILNGMEWNGMDRRDGSKALGSIQFNSLTE